MTTTTKRKLSELIREGAKLRPKAYGDFFNDISEGEHIVLGSCALGAAFEAATGTAGVNLTLASIMEFKREIKPFCVAVPRVKILNEVVFKNDCERETREQIADWLESEGF